LFSKINIFRFFIFVLLFLSGLKSIAQNPNKFNKSLKKSSLVSERIKQNNKLGIYYESVSDYPKALYHLNKNLHYFNEGKYVENKVITYNYLGYVYWHMSLYDSALWYHNQALKLIEINSISDNQLAFTYLMLGNDYFDKGDFKKSSKYYFKALKKSEEGNYLSIQVQVYNRLSKLYFKLKDYKQGKQFVNKALRINQFKDKRELAVSYNNLGNLSLQFKKLNDARHYFLLTLMNFRECGDVIGQSIASINLGDTYLALHDLSNSTQFLDSGYFYYQQSYILNNEVKNSFGMIYGLWGMADINLLKFDYPLALVNYSEALTISKEIGAKSEEMNLYFKLYGLFDKLANNDSSLVYLKKHLSLRDKIESSEQAKQLLRQESKYEYEKLIAKDKVDREKQTLLEQEKNKWKNVIIYITVIVAIIFLYVSYNSIVKLRIIRDKNEIINNINKELNQTNSEILAQKDEIERQRAIVVAQNNDIKSSILYAKRIQSAILPQPKLVKEFLEDSFIFYKPKDIVAGDFYWLEVVGDTVLFAAADCTGHGVPGAMVSVVCNNGLNRAVREFGLTNPNEILDKTRELVIQEFEKSDEEVKDGMDISLCALNTKSNVLNWSGANNPLWILRNNEILEFKGDKQPIGKHFDKKPFSLIEIQLQKNDVIYIFTDGFQDQFGGSKQKKYRVSQMRELFISISDIKMEEQRKLIDASFETWKGELEQVDDVCVIGVRI
jgi:serine phosphatase RsbU (regulator of sigma subunit)/tetratricopeptide (TPR) repeat protein